MVELFEQDIRENDRQSSKGNQLKWKNGDVCTRRCIISQTMRNDCAFL